MKSLKILTLCVFFVLLGCDSQTNSNNPKQDTQENQNLVRKANIEEKFSNIVFSGNIKVNINKTTAQNSYLTADQASMNNIEYSVKQNTLFIKSKNLIKKNNQISNININTNQINSINTSGSTKININNFIAENFKIINKGSTKIIISGKISNLEVNTSGAILLNGKNLQTLNSTIQSDGVCHIILAIKDNLNISSDGFNKILYSGEPNINKHGEGYNIIKPISQLNYEIT